MNKTAQIESKILEGSTLEQAIAIWRFQDKKVVFTNGCFDILHRGHIAYLSQAADLGNVLVVGVNADASVSKLKGPNRPLQDEHSRLMLLASLSMVSAVVLFNEDTPENLIKKVRPNVLVKGGDYEISKIVGADFVKSLNGTVLTIPFIEGYSTSAIENKIKQGSV